MLKNGTRDELVLESRFNLNSKSPIIPPPPNGHVPLTVDVIFAALPEP